MHSHIHLRNANGIAAMADLDARSEAGALPLVTPRNALNSANDFTRGLTGVNQLTDSTFVLAVIIFFCALLVLTFALRLWKMGSNHLRHLFAAGQSARDRQAIFMTNSSSWWPWVKRHVLYAPLLGKRHNREVQLGSVVQVGTLPSRFHTIVLVVYVCTNLAYCAVLDYSKPRAECWAELRGRTGSLAVLNLIPTIIFAFRNNPLIWILRVSYDTFNLLHRWTARIVIFEAVMHTIAWTVNKVEATGWPSVWKSLVHSSFLGWGTVGTVGFLIILITAVGPVRHAWYETFINGHRILALAAMVGTHVHLEHGSLPQTPYMKFCWALWILEYLMRLFYLVWLNISRHKRTKVTVEAMPSEACRVTFDLVRPWKFQPGSHIHVWLPTIGKVTNFLSTHPFSVAWTEDHVVGHFNEKLPSTEKDLDKQDKTTTSVSVVLRARTGITRKMFERAMKAPMRTFTTFGTVEGPYGGHESLDSYGTVLLFAGGVGITHQIPYIRHLVDGSSQGTVATRKIILVWSVPNTEALEWVRPWMDEILKMKGRRDVLKIMLFVTKPKSQQEVISGTGTVQMFPGRCTPQAIVDKEIIERVGAMCVAVCGPGSFADAVRQATRKRVALGSIDFVEEAFTY
ncbi:hypothetical protein FH972_025629 [Carpinus fangiana]|uniref:FAD-binding FR-type domain-containing protein n=1 Tax=Carpinus fangiana TaxID=176857 RepID=A0A5N6L1K1_9ROSI|nr:hypothetical protein FH972_025629 [Carpinus fangiana]